MRGPSRRGQDPPQPGSEHAGKPPGPTVGPRQLLLGLATSPLLEWALTAGRDRFSWPHGQHLDSLCVSLNLPHVNPQTGTRTCVVADLRGQCWRLFRQALWGGAGPRSADEPDLLGP